MKKLFIIIAVILAVAALPNKGTSQDIGFSQFYDQPLLRNPALAGIFTGDMRFAASYRNQWQSVTIPYRTFGLSGEVKMPLNLAADDNLTLGMQLIRDVAGSSQFSTLQVLPAVNYSLPLSGERNSYLSIAFMGGLMQQRFDPTKLVMGDQFIAGSNGAFSISPSSRQVFDNTSVNYLDLSAGLSYNGVINEDIDYFAGVALFHLAKPRVGFYEGNTITLNKKFAFNAGLAAPTNETDQLIFYFDYFKQFEAKFKPAGKSTFQAGFLYSTDLFVMGDVQKTLTGGLLYRLNDAIIPVVQLQLSKFVIGMSYDVNVDKLAAAAHNRGGFELVLSFRDFLNSNQKERRQSLCPRFRR